MVTGGSHVEPKRRWTLLRHPLGWALRLSRGLHTGGVHKRLLHVSLHSCVGKMKS